MAGTLKDQERKRARAFDMMAGIALTVGAIVVLVEIFVGRSGFDFGWVVDHLPGFLNATQLTFYVTTVAFGNARKEVTDLFPVTTDLLS